MRFVELRTRLHLRSQSDASPWPWCQQVHLVRFDVQRRRLHLQSDRPPREVMDDRVASAFTCSGPYAMLILSGVKYVENRSAMPVPREGRCAISVSKKFSVEV